VPLRQRRKKQARQHMQRW